MSRLSSWLRQRVPLLIISGVVAAGACLRVWTIGDGLPYAGIGPDEPAIMEVALRMLKTGDFHPAFFDYGSLTFYLHAAIAAVRFLAGAMDGEWTRLDQTWDGAYYLWARMATAAMSTATIVLAYLAGRRWGSTAGIIAAVAVAVNPQLVREAHFALTDTPLTFLCTLALVVTLSAAESGRRRLFLCAGVAVGLAAAIKYNGVLALVMPLAAAATLDAAPRRLSALAAVLGGSVLGFAAGQPYALLDVPAFLNGFASLMQHYNQSRPWADSAAIYLKYIGDWFTAIPSRIDPYRMSAWPVAGATLVGAVTLLGGLTRRHLRAVSAAVLIFPPFYFWFISHQSLIYARYALPLVPAASVLFGVGVSVLARRLAARRPAIIGPALAAGLSLVLLLPAAIDAVGWNLERRGAAPAERAAEWLVARLQPADRIVIETTDVRLPPRFRSSNTLRLVDRSVAEYRADGVTHLVASSRESDKYVADPARYAPQYQAYQEMLRETIVLARFAPEPGGPGGSTLLILQLR